MAEKEKNFKKTELIYEGKAKKLYSLDGKTNKLLQEFKDDATAFNALKKGTIENKGVINNNLTTYIFKYLEKHGVRTHFISKVSDNEMIVRKLKIIIFKIAKIPHHGLFIKSCTRITFGIIEMLPSRYLKSWKLFDNFFIYISCFIFRFT